jgi:hypothetical protein
MAIDVGKRNERVADLSKPEQTVLGYLQAEGLSQSPYANQQLEELLIRAARSEKHAFHVTCGDGQHALLTMTTAAEATVYRIDDLRLEKLSFGRLTDGVLLENVTLQVEPGADRSTVELTYLHADALELIGGSLTLNLGVFAEDDLARARTAFAALIGSQM